LSTTARNRSELFDAAGHHRRHRGQNSSTTPVNLRRHTQLAACAQRGASVAKVALDHGLNANLVHRWRRLAQGRERGGHAVQRIGEFVAVPMASVQDPPAPEEIRIEVRRGSLVVSVSWPMSAAAHSAAWLRELLR
jgi:transposase